MKNKRYEALGIVLFLCHAPYILCVFDYVLSVRLE
jgi:hypothetical protein